MEICAHCHNVLPKTVDRCTVCGTERVDPTAADVRRRESGNQPSHAPGWAAPSVPDTGIHPDDFLRELAGEEPAPSPPPSPADRPGATPILPPRPIPTTPAPGALAGYLGTNVDRRSSAPTASAPEAAVHEAGAPHANQGPSDARMEPERVPQHLSTATRVAPDGVAARTTRLDGTVKLGPTASHRTLTLGAPLLAALVLIGGIVGSYRIRTSQAADLAAASAALEIDAEAISASSGAMVRLDLDGCGIITQTTGVLFSDNTILVPQSDIVTDNRPSVSTADGSVWTAEVLGWSLTRNLAVVRTDTRLPGGLEWGVSSRVNAGDAVSVLTVGQAGVASPVPATIVKANTLDGRNVSFELDIVVAEGSVVLNAEGFVIGVMSDDGLAQVSDDLAPAISRIVLANERPQAVCPAPPTTAPPSTTVPAADGTADGSDEATPDE